LTHSPAHFRRWAMQEYDGGWCQYRVESFTPLTPLVSPWGKAGRPVSYAVRVRNIGGRSWDMRPGMTAGTHLGYILLDDKENWVATGRSGLLEADVPPGEAIDLTLVVAPISRPGRYRLLVDLVDEGHCWFFQAGAEPYEEELEIRE
jgi:hypothetical protein